MGDVDAARLGALVLLALVSSACISLPHYDTGRAVAEGQTRYLVGISAGGDTGPMYRGKLTAIAETVDRDEIPAETKTYPAGPFRANYVLGVRHGLGGGVEVRGAADTWSPAGVGGTLGLKVQVAGDAESRFAGAVLVQGAVAVAGGGSKDDGGGVVYGAGDLAFPMSVRVFDGVAFVASPRLSAGGVMFSQTKDGEDRSASDGGVAVGGSGGVALGSDLPFILEGVALHSPATGAWVFAAGIGFQP